MNIQKGMKVKIKLREELIAVSDIFPNVIPIMMDWQGEIVTIKRIREDVKHNHNANVDPYICFEIEEHGLLWSTLMIEPVVELQVNNNEFLELLGGLDI